MLGGNPTVQVEGIADENVFVKTGTLQSLEAARESKGLNLAHQLFEFHWVIGVAREDTLGGTELDPRLLPAYEHERSGGISSRLGSSPPFPSMRARNQSGRSAFPFLSHADPLHQLPGYNLLPPVVQPCRSGVAMPGEVLDIFEA
jgi:hypothetical protein